MGERLDFSALTALTFEKPDPDTFRGLKLAYEAGRVGGSMPTVFNAANEMAVELFLEGRISYLAMAEWIERAMDAHTVIAEPSLEEILEVEQRTRRLVAEGAGN